MGDVHPLAPEGKYSRFSEKSSDRGPKGRCNCKSFGASTECSWSFQVSTAGFLGNFKRVQLEVSRGAFGGFMEVFSCNSINAPPKNHQPR